MTDPGRRLRVVDGAGAVLLLLYVSAIFVGARDGGSPGPMVGLVLGSAGALVLGRLLGRIQRVILPCAVVVAGGMVLVSGPVIGGGPLEGPFGYRNATGAFLVLATIAALMVTASDPRWWVRIPFILAALAFAIVATADSAAAGVSLIAVLLSLFGLLGPRGARLSIVLAAMLFAVVLVGTIVVGAGYRPGVDTLLTRALTERRLVLWHESLQIIAAEPDGVGPGRFDEVSPTAGRDADARWAHNEFLQQGVELGIVGAALLLSIIVWGFVRLWVRPSPDLVTGLAAAALAALLIHACVDYVLHFPAVPLAAAALVGTGQAVQFRRSRDAHDDPRQEGIESDAHALGVAGAPSQG